MKVLVLRPERAAARTAEALAARGHEAVLAPVLTIEDVASPIPGGPYDAVLATSANGLRKLRSRPEMAGLARTPLIAVGDRTAEAGREAGFATVRVAEPDGRALAAEVMRRFPAPGRFLHAAGADRAFDLAGALGAAGHRVDVVELYRARAADALPGAALEALRQDTLGGVLHHSRRIAETFLALAAGANMIEAARALPHAALALRVAEPLHAAGCPRVAVADRPDEAALLDALDRLLEAGSHSADRRSN